MSLAAIFDVDGVLVDSCVAHFQSWRDVAPDLVVHSLRELSVTRIAALLEN